MLEENAMMPLSSSEIAHIASESAKAAVRETLLALGVNMADPNAVLEMQKDFAHVRLWRQSAEAIRQKGLMAAVGIVVSGIAGAIWMAISARGGH